VQKKGKLDSNDNEKLERLRALFAIDDQRAISTLKSLAAPVYREAVQGALESIGDNSGESYASIYGKLALRQTELGLSADVARSVLADEVSSRGSEIVKKASKFLRVQNMNGCVSILKELLVFGDKVVELVNASEINGREDVETLGEYMGDSIDGLSRTEPQQMYRIFLSDCLSDRKVDEDEEVSLRRLRTILKLSDEEAQRAYKSAAGPVYRKLVNDALTENKLDTETKSNIEEVRSDLGLALDISKGISIDLYKDKVRNLVQGNRIIQESEAQDLFLIREFIGMDQADNYRAGLERLRNRLALAKDDADAAFHNVVKQRMKVYVERALSHVEKRSQFRGQNENRDVGEDPTIKRAGATLGMDTGGLSVELSNLVDFYVRNKLVVEEEIEIGEEKRKITRYPITLRDEIPEKVYNELYKQYLVQCFSASSRGEKQRLFAALDQLGSILGMTEPEVAAIHANIGQLIYKNYVTQALSKGPLDEKDTEFLANIEKMLSMQSEQCASIMKDAKENRVSLMFEQVLQAPKVLPESIKKARETAALLDVDIVGDLDISVDQRARLFGVEVDAAIDRGELTAEKRTVVETVGKALQIPEEKSRSVLLDCIQRRCLSHMVQAAASLRQERSETAVSELRTMLRYGKLLPSKVRAPAVSTGEKQELFLLFQAFVITDGTMTENAKDEIELLKTMFGFSDADLGAVV